jgi:predicted small secreted protein
LSCGGTDTLANVKLAHFACNTRRGVGGVVQLAMV